jgi:CDP-diglyceride synthetase
MILKILILIILAIIMGYKEINDANNLFSMKVFAYLGTLIRIAVLIQIIVFMAIKNQVCIKVMVYIIWVLSVIRIIDRTFCYLTKNKFYVEDFDGKYDEKKQVLWDILLELIEIAGAGLFLLL